MSADSPFNAVIDRTRPREVIQSKTHEIEIDRNRRGRRMGVGMTVRICRSEAANPRPKR